MRAIPHNPIVMYLNDLLAGGKTTKEKICVAAELKYKTFDNVFIRPTVSIMVRKSLLMAGIIPAKIATTYDVWFNTVWLPSQKGVRRGRTKTRLDSRPELPDEAEGTA